MKVNEFLESIKASYKKEFPNSIIKAELGGCLGKNIYIRCYLAGDKKEFTNGIEQNDMFSITFWASNLPKEITIESELPEDLVLECRDKSYLIKPENQYLYYSRKNLSYRKTKGDKKILTSLDKFFKRLKEGLIKDIENDNIHSNHIELVKKKIA